MQEIINKLIAKDDKFACTITAFPKEQACEPG
jgi:hypothetical protein